MTFATAALPSAANRHRWLIRWLLLLPLLPLETAALIVRYQAPRLFAPPWAHDAIWWLFHDIKELWSPALWIAGACLVTLSPQFRTIRGEWARHRPGEHPWLGWLGGHIAVAGALMAVSAVIFNAPADPGRLLAPWVALWLALGAALSGLWLLALAPGRFWLGLLTGHRLALLAGCALGIGAWLLFGMFTRHEAPLAQKEFWGLLAMPTLQLVHLLLSGLYGTLVYQPENYLIGTPAFKVIITHACSGIEGIALITLFLSVYLWLFRRELRFPQAFWLFPLGIVAIWLANALRLALLIVIATHLSPELALEGFHLQAGWVAFSLIALAAIALATQMPFFNTNGITRDGVYVANPSGTDATITRDGVYVANPSGTDATITRDGVYVANPSGTEVAAVAAEPSPASGQALAVALLMPLLAMLGASMITASFSTGFDLLYPVRTVIIALLLGYFYRRYAGLGWSWSWQAPAIGVAVFIIWMLLEPDNGTGENALTRGLAGLGGELAAGWLTFRVLGSVIVVPLIEEFAFRGYLMRKLIDKNFEQVPPGQFSWPSLLLSSLLFGLLHDRWLAGSLAGAAYALALCRRGQIGDAVLAHLCTNALIAVWVLGLGHWSLWL